MTELMQVAFCKLDDMPTWVRVDTVVALTVDDIDRTEVHLSSGAVIKTDTLVNVVAEKLVDAYRQLDT